MQDTHVMLPATRLETRDLALVRAIAESGGVTRAAKLLHLSQSAVSHQLRGLEDKLGVQLFERRGRTLRITAAGERMLAVSRQVLEPIALLEAELRSAGRVERELRVAAQCYTAFHWLPKALPELSLSYPEVRLSIQAIPTPAVPEALEAGELDLGLCLNPPKGRRLSAERLFSDELWLIVSRAHPLATRAWVDAAQLADEVLLLFDTPVIERERVAKQLFPNGGGFKQILRLPLVETILELVQVNMGVAILPGWSVAHRIQRGELAQVRLTRRGVKRGWLGVYPSKTELLGPIRALLATVKRLGPAARL